MNCQPKNEEWIFVSIKALILRLLASMGLHTKAGTIRLLQYIT